MKPADAPSTMLVITLARVGRSIVVKGGDVAIDLEFFIHCGIKPFLVQRGSFQGVAKCYD